MLLLLAVIDSVTSSPRLYWKGSHKTIEWLGERTEHLSIFIFSAHHSLVFCFWWSVYWWKGSVRF